MINVEEFLLLADRPIPASTVDAIGSATAFEREQFHTVLAAEFEQQLAAGKVHEKFVPALKTYMTRCGLDVPSKWDCFWKVWSKCTAAAKLDVPPWREIKRFHSEFKSIPDVIFGVLRTISDWQRAGPSRGPRPFNGGCITYKLRI